MNRALVALLLALTLHAESQEIEVITAYPACYHATVRNMHADAVHRPRLFTRTGAVEFDAMCMVNQLEPIEHQLTYDGRPHVRLSTAIEAYRQIFHGHHHDLTEAEWLTLRKVLDGFGVELVLVDWNHMTGDVGGFDPQSGTMFLPEVDLATEGLPAREIVLHEFAHLAQFWAVGHGATVQSFLSSPLRTDSMEFAAMVVETAALINDGYTRAEFEAVDRHPVTMEAGYILFGHQLSMPMRPRLTGGLVYDYVVKYGPKLNGDMAHDLDEVRRWIVSFEVTGQQSFLVTWMAEARAAIVEHRMTDLSAAAQEFLGINGEPCLYPLSPGEIEDNPEPVLVPLDVSDLPADRAAAVRAFLTRCGAEVTP